MVRTNLKRTLSIAVLVGVGTLPMTLWAQQQMPKPRLNPGTPGTTMPPPVATGVGGKTLNFKCNLGSFKLLPKSGMADGHIEMSFTGTLLVSQFDGKITVSGNLKKEFEGYGRAAYFGTGKVVIDGKFRGVQWFGSGLSGKWTGNGVARLYGEFDRNLDTGKYWYENLNDVKPWGTYGLTAEVPERVMSQGDTNVVPKRRGG